MSTADKIGLLSGFSWMAGHGILVTVLICWGLTPVGHLVVGLVGESRWVPISPNKQYLSFFPGDLLLGMTAASLLVLAQRLPDTERWYNSTIWHVIVLVGALVVASGLTFMEWKGEFYPHRAIMSPTKLYHNFLLYGGYGYVIVATLIAVVAGGPWSPMYGVWLFLCLVPSLVWIKFLERDNSLKGSVARSIADHAHIADWQPLWSTGHIRRS